MKVERESMFDRLVLHVQAADRTKKIVFILTSFFTGGGLYVGRFYLDAKSNSDKKISPQNVPSIQYLAQKINQSIALLE